MLLHVVEALTKPVQPGEAIDREVGPGSGSPQIRLREGMEGRGGGEMGQIPEGFSSLRTGLKGETEGRKDGGVGGGEEVWRGERGGGRREEGERGWEGSGE